MSFVVGDSQISLKLCRRHLLAAIQLAVSCSELYFARCCALKRTGTFACIGKQGYVFILMFDVSQFPTSISVSTIVLRLRKVEFIKLINVTNVLFIGFVKFEKK